MKYSLKLGRPFGIKISIHWTFLLLIAWVVIIDVQQGLNFQQIMLSVLFILTLFVCVVLHELGHSLAAIKFGSEVRSITLLPIGGMANIRKIPEKPMQELIMTVAGLAVNVVIALILLGILLTRGGLDLEQMDFKTITPRNFLTMLMFVNLFVVFFNLIPAFPMDGGRILRALFSMRMNRLKATRWAKNTGQFFAVAFVMAGLFLNPFLVVIGVFVFIGASAEYNLMKLGESIKAYSASDAMITDYMELAPEETLEKAAETLVHHHENGFVVAANGRIEGILTSNDIIKGLSNNDRGTTVREIMNADYETVAPDASLQEVFQMIQTRKIAIIPIVKNGRIKGIIDKDNIHQFIMVKNAMNE
jgi:Zn-dependent protease/CBS domain-containing protein